MSDDNDLNPINILHRVGPRQIAFCILSTYIRLKAAGTVLAIYTVMPHQATIQRARRDAREGKAPSTQAGEFVREEFHHIREGKHGARSAKQAIAIGLSKARRAGVRLPPPPRGKTTGAIRRQAERDYAKGHSTANRRVSARRSRATLQALLRQEGKGAASTRAISRQSRAAARRKTPSQRSAMGRKAVRTKGRHGLSAAAKKAARTRLITETLNIL